MDVAARVTCKGQITIPKAIRDALDLQDGDQVVFRLDGDRALIARTPNLLELGSSVSAPAARRRSAWDEVIARADGRATRLAAADRRAGVEATD
jgi:AbrB family looped-hinge helix DNA binding protein